MIVHVCIYVMEYAVSGLDARYGSTLVERFLRILRVDFRGCLL